MSKHTFGQWVFALRPWSIPASAMPIIVTIAYLFYKNGSHIDWLMGAWTLVGMVLFHLAGNVWSDYFDFKKKVDNEDTYGAKTLTTGMFQPKEILRLAITLLVVSLICGFGLAAVTIIKGYGLNLLWIGLAGAVLTIGYPYLKYHALGDLDIILCFSVLPTLGTSLTTTGVLDWNVLWVALPVGLITDAILHANNTRDIEFDKRANIKTMAMKMGNKVAAEIYNAEMILPFIWVGVLSILGILPYTTVFIFLTLPIALACVRTMRKTIETGHQMIADLDVRTANVQLLFSLILTIGLIVGRFTSKIYVLF